MSEGSAWELETSESGRTTYAATPDSRCSDYRDRMCCYEAVCQASHSTGLFELAVGAFSAQSSLSELQEGPLGSAADCLCRYSRKAEVLSEDQVTGMLSLSAGFCFPLLV